MSDSDSNDSPPHDSPTSQIKGATTPSERDLQTSSTYRALANSLPLSVLIKSCDGRRVFANTAYLKWRNLRWEDVAGKIDVELFSDEIAKKYTDDDQEVLESGQSNHAVEQSRLADGTVGWIERIKSPIYDGAGKLLGLQVLFWDVTARIQAEQTSRFEQSLLNTLLRNIPDSIYFKDVKSRFIRVSQAMAEKFGRLHPEEIQGKSDADIFTPEHAEQARHDEMHVIRTGEPLVDRIERETWPDQDDTWCLTTKMPLQDESGEVIGTFGISRDITALKRSEAALQEAVRMADEANRAKSEFLANMSHEIRTPMNALVGMADLLAQTQLDEGQQEYVDTIRRSSDSLLRLLNDILDFSKIEARKLELESVVFSILYEIQAAISTLRYQAAKKELQLRIDVDSNLPTHFLGDPGRFRQVLVNLIGNAVKFTDRGHVTVSLQRLHDPNTNTNGQTGDTGNTDENVTMRIAVIDTGIGIAPAQQAAVLAPFTQADASMTRRFGGTGLGLSISRQLVELMGGTLQLQSKLGSGTTFFFDVRLPVADGDASIKYDDDLEGNLSVDLSTPTHALRVLVAEDGVTNQHVIAGLLRSLGHECTIASDGRETLARWRSETFDVVLMDMHMPVMDGLETTQAIRQQELGTEHHIPIIALTAAAMAEDAKLCKEAGMDKFLTKPIRRRRLQQIFATIEPASPREHPPGASPGGASRKSHPTISRHASGQRSASLDSIVLSEQHDGCLDLDSARSRIPGGVSGVLRLAAVFREECENLVEQLQVNLRSGDNDAARRNAHTLKGASGLLGAKKLQSTASEIETAGRNQQISDPDRAAELLQSLQTQSARALAAVTELLTHEPE